MELRLECIIQGCNSNNSSNSKETKVSFFPVPSVNNYNKDYLDLSTRRRIGWIISINRPEITFENSEELKVVVCSRHFFSGRPAILKDESDPDWLPSLNLKLDSAGDEMIKYRLSQFTSFKNKKTRRIRKAWTVQKRKKKRKRPFIPLNEIIPLAKLTDSTTNDATDSESSHCSSTENDDNEEPRHHFEIPVLNDFIRGHLLSVLQNYHLRFRDHIIKNRPLAVLTSNIYKDKGNFVTWNCKDIRSGGLWFAATTNLEKMEMSKEMLNCYGYSLSVRDECEREFVALLNNMTEHKCPFLEITCNSINAVLHLDKFHCPGATRRCVEYNGTLVTPLELMRAAGPFSPKDWKYHFKVHNNGSILGVLFDSGKFDFTDHDKFCTQLCLPSKQSMLIELDEMYKPPDLKPMRSKCCLPFCINHISTSARGIVAYYSLPTEKERCELWLRNMGVFHHDMGQDFAKIHEANLKICSDHFDDNQFYRRIHSRVKHLRHDAVPTVIQKEHLYDMSTWHEKQVSANESPFASQDEGLNRWTAISSSLNSSVTSNRNHQPACGIPSNSENSSIQFSSLCGRM